MSDYHVLGESKDQKTIGVVFHIPTPLGNNSAGVPWSDALVASLGGSSNITSVLTDIGTPEMNQMTGGNLIERAETYRYSVLGLTPAQKIAEIEARYTAISTEVIAELQQTLILSGAEGDLS